MTLELSSHSCMGDMFACSFLGGKDEQPAFYIFMLFTIMPPQLTVFIESKLHPLTCMLMRRSKGSACAGCRAT